MPRKTLFDDAWRFCLGDVQGAENAGYADNDWRAVTLPHDWSIEQPITRDAPAGNDGGYYPTGIGWYRKTFTLPASLAGERLWLYFEGVYMNATVYVNGQKVGGHAYGYTSFYCDITEAARPGQKNVVAVRVDNSLQKNCRWYSGSGIYRHVWLMHVRPLHIGQWGVSVRTPKVSRQEATVEVTTTLQNEGKTPKTAEVVVETAGQSAKQSITIAAGEKRDIVQSVVVSQPRLWDVSAPQLYDVKVSVVADGQMVDQLTQTYGIRQIDYSTDGLTLNGRPIVLNGGCVHHDNGLLGAAAFDRAEVRKAELMKKGGFNAVRTSHNPPSEAFLDACDRLGLLVIDEAFDGWRDKKTEHDYSTLFDEYWRDDMSALILRDRNHPSIMAWSIGNEVIERKKLEVVTTAHHLAQLCHSLDPRPVTSALASWDKDWEIYDPLAAEHDIVGYNYMLHKAESDHERVPSRVMWQTESYPRDAFTNWTRVTDHPYIIGDFVWTAIDYLGESGIGRYWYDGEVPGEHYQRDLFPCHAAYCGDIDMTGWRKPINHYRSLLYNDNEKLYLAVREPNGYQGTIRTGLWAVWPTWESWNWPGHEGKDIEVEVYSRYPKVRLYLNDELIGEQLTDRSTAFKATFTLPYREGTLRAEGISDGKVAETTTIASAGRPAAIRLTTTDRQIKADGQDLAYVEVEIVDKKGRVCPNAALNLVAEASGSAFVAAAGSADIKDTASSIDGKFTTWKGRGLIVLRSNGRSGKAKLMVKADGLSASLAISAK